MTKAEIQNLVRQKAREYGLDEQIALAQISQESKFNPKAVSGAGAQGVAQFMPGTAKRFGLVNPFDPEQALEAWAQYMTFLLNMFGWDRYDLALAGYNWGENRAVLINAAKTGAPFPATKVPAETRNYVTLILANAKNWSAYADDSSGSADSTDDSAASDSSASDSTGAAINNPPPKSDNSGTIGILILAVLVGLAISR